MRQKGLMLVAEDRDEDVEILKLAFQRAQLNVPLHFVRNGEEAIEYLQGEGRFANRGEYPLPRVLLLDLNMPIMSGFDVLEWLRLQPGLRRLLVVVFTSSDLPEDVNRAFDLGANSYLVKPVSFTKLQETMRHLEQYWLKLNAFPDYAVGSAPGGAKMQVLLRNVDTQQYFCGMGAWSSDPKLALNFERSERAVQTGIALKLGKFGVIVNLGR